jgi:hypothetical protein
MRFGKTSLPFVFLLLAFAGCESPPPTPESAFEKLAPDMKACCALIEKHGGEIVHDDEWQRAYASLQTHGLTVIPKMRGRFVVFEVLTRPLDLNYGFIFVPEGNTLDDYRVLVRPYHQPKQIADHWYWAYCD